MIKKRILLGISGGIAAYKCAELVRLLAKHDSEVRVVMTEAALQFVSPLTLQALSGSAVHTSLLMPEQEQAMSHIALARWADLLLIAPATANMIAKLSHGLADDLLSTLYLVAECPIYIAPAMNQSMWRKAVTQHNIQLLQRQGVRLIGPEAGEQACGEVGFGRMSEPETICRHIFERDLSGSLKGRKLLLTAGPTHEPIDPVRYITNRSSGKMGYALAKAARDAGAEVILVSGPVALSAPRDVQLFKVRTAAQMLRTVMEQVEGCDVFIAAAAVADFTPAECSAIKLKKESDELNLHLAKTRDILAEVAALPNPPFTVGFAAETTDLEHYAQDKLRRKNLDMIAANWVGQAQGGFEDDLNALQVFWKAGQQQFAMMPKTELATQLIALIAERLHQKS